jgi:hypothetical protein
MKNLSLRECSLRLAIGTVNGGFDREKLTTPISSPPGDDYE